MTMSFQFWSCFTLLQRKTILRIYRTCWPCTDLSGWEELRVVVLGEGDPVLCPHLSCSGWLMYVNKII